MIIECTCFPSILLFEYFFYAATLSILMLLSIQFVQAFVALLYPFSWQYIFIPVLPKVRMRSEHVALPM